MDVSRQRQELLLRQHGNAFFADRGSRLFQVQGAVDRHREHIVSAGSGFSDQRLEHPVRALAQKKRHPFPVRRIRIVDMDPVRDAPGVQQPQHIGLVIGFFHVPPPFPLIVAIQDRHFKESGMVIDFHAHVYPEKIALKAAQSIGEFYGVPMAHPGSVPELLSAMDAGGIDRALIHSVALNPSRAATINDFISGQVREHPDRLYGYATLHPDMTESEAADELERALSLGLRGVKLHNDMQRISLEDPRMDKIYAVCQDTCPLLLHMGDDRYHYDNPHMIPPILRRFPRLRLICAHMGGYTEWEEARSALQHEDVAVDCSSSYFRLGNDGMKSAIRFFGADRVLFGTDFPMWDPPRELRFFLDLDITEDEKEKILHRNAEALLNL